MTEKNILCFGDSNTWGYDPASGQRLPLKKRWTGILQELLGMEYRIIDEGLNGRTTIWDDPAEGSMGDKNGLKALPVCLSTHSPLDLVLVMLGTNDLKKRFSVTAFEASLGIGRIAETVKRHNYFPVESVPRVCILSPPWIRFLHEDFKGHFLESAPEESRRFHQYYREIAEKNSCYYLDTAPFTETEGGDGIHIPENAQRVFAEEIYKKILEIFPK